MYHQCTRAKHRITILSVLASGMLLVSGCKARSNASTLRTVEAAPVCNEGMIIQVLEERGILEGLQTPETSCLDDAVYIPPMDPTPAPNAIAFDPAANQEAEGLGLAQNHDLVMRIIVGMPAFNEVLRAVNQRAMTRQNTPTQMPDIAQIRQMADQYSRDVKSMLATLNLRARLIVAYSYNDLYAVVKTNYADPQVYGYNGIGSNIIHRRYSRGRGIAYRVVGNMLSQGLADAQAQITAELGRINDPTMAVQVGPIYQSLAYPNQSYAEVFLDQKLVGQRLTFADVKQAVNGPSRLSDLIKMVQLQLQQARPPAP